MHELVSRFRNFILEEDLFQGDAKLLLAVSGGVDSVVLCELCRQSGFDFAIAHANFQLRGEESVRDEQFVTALAKHYGVAFFSKRFDTEAWATENKQSIQEAARYLRYNWFSEIILKELLPAIQKESPVQSAIPGWRIPARQIVLLTAHHADDNAETLLMNISRGTGLQGMTGIPLKGDGVGKSISSLLIRRPMLNFSRKEIEVFARENDLQWVEDSSNAKTAYTRNLLRHDVIPALEKVYPGLRSNLQHTIERFRDIRKLYDTSVAAIKKKICKVKGDEIHIPIKQLLGYNSRSLVYDVISEHGFSEKQVEEVFRLAQSESGKYIVNPGSDKQIIRHRHWFIICPVQPDFSEHIVIEEGQRSVKLPAGELKIEETGNMNPDSDPSAAWLDRSLVQFPLLLRRWKTGDYFYPLGMKKKKKVARFFIDQKLSKTEKEKAWVIEMNRKIVWVMGYRIDDRFRITGNTRKCLHLRFIPSE